MDDSLVLGYREESSSSLSSFGLIIWVWFGFGFGYSFGLVVVSVFHCHLMRHCTVEGQIADQRIIALGSSQNL